MDQNSTELQQSAHNKNLGKLDIALHWATGLGIIGLISLGIFMKETKNYGLYSVHKSIGVLLFLIIAWRVINRIQKGWPEKLSVHKAWEMMAARVSHWLLLLGTLALPLSGMLDSLMAGRGLSVFGVSLISSNLGEDGKRVALSKAMSDLAGEIHSIAGYVLIAVISLHVAAALKHHLLDKDPTLNRMLGKG